MQESIEETKKVSVNFPIDIYEKLKAIAPIKDRNFGQQVVWYCRQGLKEDENKTDIIKPITPHIEDHE